MDSVKQHLQGVIPKLVGQPLSILASALVQAATDLPKGAVIGITGPSSVGKSTFASIVARQSEDREITCGVLSADDFLNRNQRGSGTSFRIASGSPLRPSDFDFPALKRVLALLQRGESVVRPSYSRGEGWVRDKLHSPTDIFIIDGLFLDALAATKFVDFAVIVTLEAPWDVIADLRRKRDSGLRHSHKDIRFRSAKETEAEIDTAREAYLDYSRDEHSFNHISVCVSRAFTVARIE